MSILGAFSVSTLAMRSQTTALHMIGTNVSNVQTGGYRRTDVQFQSVLGNQMFHEGDQGGIRPTVHQRIDSQGQLTATNSARDLAIAGDGFFVTSTDFEATDIVYTRDGSFHQTGVSDVTVTDYISGVTYTTKDAYLVDKNGHFLLGYAPNTDETFPTTGTPLPMRVDANAFSDTGLPTTAAQLIVNLDSNASTVTDHLTAVSDYDVGGLRAEGMEFLTIDFVDTNGNRQSARLNFTKSDINLWESSATYHAAGTAQVDTITLGGTIEIGDLYSVKVGNATASYVVQDGDTLSSIVDNLVEDINQNTQITAEASAAVGDEEGTILLTAATAGTAFTSTAGTTNAQPTAQIDTLTIDGTAETGDVFEYTIDSTTASYTVTATDTSITDVVNGLVAAINSTAIINSTVNATAGTGTGEIVLTARSSGVAFTGTSQALDTSSTAQVDTVTIGSDSSSFEPGDLYSIDIDDTAISYTITGLEGGLTGIRTAIVDAINADATISSIVTASNGGSTGDIALTANVPGTAFTTTTSTTNADPTAQVDTATLSGTVEAGDIYKITVNGTAVSYTVTGAEGDLASIRTAIVDSINADATVSAIVTASNGSNDGEVVLTADVPGTAFTATPSATNGGGTNDNTMTLTTTQANVSTTDDNTAVITATTANVVGANPNTATIVTTQVAISPVDDGTASSVTTTANVSGLTTTAATQIEFFGNGTVDTPDNISFSFTFPASGSDPESTATFELDISELTQFDNRFQLQMYSENGYENALIQDIGFDTEGHLIGYFTNGRTKELYQIPLAKFANPNALENANGLVFRETETSGAPVLETVTSSGIATFVPSSIEVSNVNLVDQFTSMIRTQQAYNSSANAFRTVDEMFQTLVQTKR